ncbi:MAG: TolC family outer membrane protein [Magnetococcales bacterium]|nr:TolC family outer membrane protein [Magnetococcales bacterium]
MMKRHLSTLSSLLLLTLLTLATPLKAQTLSEAVSKAVQTNPELLAERQKQAAVEQQIGQARAGYLPSVDINAGYGREYSDNTTTRAAKPPNGTLTLNRREATVTAKQMLFDGFATSHAVDKAESTAASARHNQQKVLDTVIQSTSDYYLEAYKQEQLLELVKDNVVLHQRILEKIKQKFESGAGTEADVQQTETRWALTSALQVATDTAYKNARIRFIRTIGEAPKDLTKPSINTALLPKSSEAAVEVALKQHPAVLAAQADLVAAKADLAATQASSFIPRFDLELSALKNADVGGSIGDGTGMAAMLRMNYNLLRGGGDLAKNQENHHKVNQAQETLDQRQREVIEGVRTAWELMEMSRNRITYLKQHAEISRKVADAYHQQFKMGKRTLLDVLNTETELFTARSSLITEDLNYLMGFYRLLGSMGQITQAFNK